MPPDEQHLVCSNCGTDVGVGSVNGRASCLDCTVSIHPAFQRHEPFGPSSEEEADFRAWWVGMIASGETPAVYWMSQSVEAHGEGPST